MNSKRQNRKNMTQRYMKVSENWANEREDGKQTRKQRR